MNRPITQVRSHLVAFLILLAAGPVVKAGTPSADQILQAARLNPMSQQARLKAELETADGDKIPFTLTMDHGVVSYDFTNPDQRIQLVLGVDSSELRESVGSRTVNVKPARYDQKVRGTPITYEDLALRLLYWPKPKVVGEEIIRLRKAWKLELQAPKGQSQYGVAWVWIDEGSGAIMRIEGYDTKGRLMKDFEVLSGQQIDGRWMLKTMRVQSHDPQTQKVLDRTLLKILGADK